jgi:hypothetical protein
MAAIGEGDQSGAGSEIGNGGRPNMSAKIWHKSWISLVLVLWQGLSLPHSEVDPSLWRKPKIAYVSGDIGQLTTSNVSY